jgi:hypothetical protein
MQFDAYSRYRKSILVQKILGLAGYPVIGTIISKTKIFPE